MATSDRKAFIEPYPIADGKRCRLKTIDPADIGGLGSEHKQGGYQRSRVRADGSGVNAAPTDGARLYF
jgi:hypothetical protein